MCFLQINLLHLAFPSFLWISQISKLSVCVYLALQYTCHICCFLLLSLNTLKDTLLLCLCVWPPLYCVFPTFQFLACLSQSQQLPPFFLVAFWLMSNLSLFFFNLLPFLIQIASLTLTHFVFLPLASSPQIFSKSASSVWGLTFEMICHASHSLCFLVSLSCFPPLLSSNVL